MSDSMEELYQNASFDYLDSDDINNNEEIDSESLNTTEDFLVDLTYNFYQRNKI